MVSKTLLGIGLIGGGLLAAAQLGSGEKPKTSGGGGGQLFTFGKGEAGGTKKENITNVYNIKYPDIPTDYNISGLGVSDNQTKKESKGYTKDTALGGKAFYSSSDKLIGVEDPLKKQTRLPTSQEQFFNKPLLFDTSKKQQKITTSNKKAWWHFW